MTDRFRRNALAQRGFGTDFKNEKRPDNQMQAFFSISFKNLLWFQQLSNISSLISVCRSRLLILILDRNVNFFTVDFGIFGRFDA